MRTGCLNAVMAVVFGLSALTMPAAARTSNGNELALSLTEAKTAKEKAAVLAEAKGRPHYFRYLQIMEMEDRSSTGEGVTITAFEPSSYMDVKFVVTKRVSLGKLSEDPASKVGDAIAVTGIVKSAEKNALILGPVIVRHKDRLAPTRGKEMLYEVDASATFYSFTGGKRPVNVSYRDRDLLQYKNSVIAQHGRQGWGEFLERELAKRKKARASAGKSGETTP